MFGYLGYLLTRGLVERQPWGVAVAVFAGLLFGWQITGVLPGTPNVSWEGHLSGFLAGAVAAILFRRRRPKPAAPDTDGGPTLRIPTSDAGPTTLPTSP